jgi:hypothetical protein
VHSRSRLIALACLSRRSIFSTPATAVNINWRSGASFEKATTILGPRIIKFGVKFDWQQQG